MRCSDMRCPVFFPRLTRRPAKSPFSRVSGCGEDELHVISGGVSVQNSISMDMTSLVFTFWETKVGAIWLVLNQVISINIPDISGTDYRFIGILEGLTSLPIIA